MKTESLVGPANIREQVRGKLADMKRNNLTRKQKELIDILEVKLVRGLKLLSERYFGINREQILELSDDEINALVDIVYGRAKKPGTFIKILCLGITLEDVPTVWFTDATRKLKKMRNNNFNPAETTRALIGRY